MSECGSAPEESEDGSLHGGTKKRRRTEAFDAKYRIDRLVEDLVAVELKSVDRLLPVHQTQVTYLISRVPRGLLINRNVTKLIDDVKRLINSHVCKQ